MILQSSVMSTIEGLWLISFIAAVVLLVVVIILLIALAVKSSQLRQAKQSAQTSTVQTQVITKTIEPVHDENGEEITGYTIVIENGEESLLFEEEIDEAAPTKSTARTTYVVKFERAKNSWIIHKKGQTRVVRRLDTKEEAMRAAKALCRKYDANLTVHKKDGKFQKVR